MNRQLTFERSEVERLWNHTLQCTEWHLPYKGAGNDPNTKPEPALHWIKDQGTYLMSNGTPGLEIGCNASYATGLGADADWQTVRDICGGDDFCETIPGDAVRAWLQLAEQNNSTKLVLQFDDTSISLTVPKHPA